MKKSFSEYAVLSQRLKTVLHTDPGWINYDPIAAELLDKVMEFAAGAITREGHGSWQELPSIVALATSQGYLQAAKPAPTQLTAQAIRAANVQPLPTSQHSVQAVEEALRNA